MNSNHFKNLALLRLQAAYKASHNRIMHIQRFDISTGLRPAFMGLGSSMPSGKTTNKSKISNCDRHYRLADQIGLIEKRGFTAHSTLVKGSKDEAETSSAKVCRR
jgi:hypothetical protein